MKLDLMNLLCVLHNSKNLTKVFKRFGQKKDVIGYKYESGMEQLQEERIYEKENRNGF